MELCHARVFLAQTRTFAAAAPPPGRDGFTLWPLLGSLWDVFNGIIAFTANVWQNIDGLVFIGIAVYLLIRLAKSVLGHDESTIKTFDQFRLPWSLPT